MDYNLMVNWASMAMFVFASLVFTVNIIVEVIKKNFPKIPTSLLATVLSLLVAILAFFGWAAYTGFQIWWYHIVGVVVLGLFVAYAAMFGFDKFKQAFEKLKSYKK